MGSQVLASGLRKDASPAVFGSDGLGVLAFLESNGTGFQLVAVRARCPVAAGCAGQ
jgi:hypothetical protein